MQTQPLPGIGEAQMNLQDILELDFEYLTSFTNSLERPWGTLFYNVEQPVYFDANHAHVDKINENPGEMIDEVLDFYTSKNLMPRFYIYNLEEQLNLFSALEEKGFKVEELESPVQLWNGQQLKQQCREDVVIERVGDHNFHQALEIECSIEELGGRAVREKSFPEEYSHPAFTHYLLRYKGTACATACIFASNYIARLETVATLRAFRGKGLIGELISFIQKEVKNSGYEKLWVHPINDRVAKVYQRYGFENAGNLKMKHAYYSGRSITEIQNS
jgi:GNAT superfamily N-acetyltransferase